MTFLFFVLFLFSLGLNFVLLIELLVKQKMLIRALAVSDKSRAQDEVPIKKLSFLEGENKKEDFSNRSSFPVFNPGEPITPLPNFYKNQDGNFELAEIPKQLIFKEEKDFYLLEESFLANFVFQSSLEIKEKFLPYNSNLYLNLIFVDIETNDNQILIGFYFASLNLFVQFIVWKNFSDFTGFQLILQNFFTELCKLSSVNQLILSNLSVPNSPKEGNAGDSENSVVLTILSGYNLKNFDLPILDCFLNCNLDLENPVSCCRELAVKFLTLKERKDFTKFSNGMLGFFVIDVFWQTGQRLNTWVSILNKTNLFPELKRKSWKKPKDSPYPSDVLDLWLVYNRNDLLATYFLGLYKKNFLNYFQPRFLDFLNNISGKTLVELLNQRYLK